MLGEISFSTRPTVVCVNTGTSFYLSPVNRGTSKSTSFCSSLKSRILRNTVGPFFKSSYDPAGLVTPQIIKLTSTTSHSYYYYNMQPGRDTRGHTVIAGRCDSITCRACWLMSPPPPFALVYCILVSLYSGSMCNYYHPWLHICRGYRKKALLGQTAYHSEWIWGKGMGRGFFRD